MAPHRVAEPTMRRRVEKTAQKESRNEHEVPY
jgi:hypothetical protein